MKDIKRIAVYCASNTGNNRAFYDTAYALGNALADRNIELVYGGAKVGLMGAVADGVLNKGGKVIGVLPHFLGEKELQHESLTELIMVENMHERKFKMSELADAFITLPGGFGTMEEMFEVLTWGQLSLHKKPIAIYNVDGYYNSLFDFIEKMISSDFLKEEYRDLLLKGDSVEKILNLIENYEAPTNEKWHITK